jgi:hypothetical protein
MWLTACPAESKQLERKSTASKKAKAKQPKKKAALD